MAYEHRPNSGTAFKNKFKTTENQPAMKGDGLGQCPHCNGTWDIDLAIWRKNDRNGNGYVSISLAPKETQPQADTPDSEPQQETFDDIPF